MKKDTAITAATIISKSLTKLIKTAGDAAIAYGSESDDGIDGRRKNWRASIGASPAVSTGS